MKKFKKIFWPVFLFLSAYVFYFFNDLCLKIIEFFNSYYLGIFVIIFLFYCIYIFVENWITKDFYKRERGNSNKKYLVQRCYEDGFGYNHDGKTTPPKVVPRCDKNGNCIDNDENDEDTHRDYYYLVDRENKKFHRIVDGYTLQQLGYPRPSRKSVKCFKLSDEYVIGEEIKIYNIISDIKEIIKLKDK